MFQFSPRTNSRIQESRENYYYNSSTKNENSRILNFGKSPKIRNSRKFKHAKITRSTVGLMAVAHNIGVQMNLKDLSKTFMMIYDKI